MHRFFLKGREERKNVGTRMVTRKNRHRKNSEKMYGFLISHIGGTEFLSVPIKMINAE